MLGQCEIMQVTHEDHVYHCDIMQCSPVEGIIPMLVGPELLNCSSSGVSLLRCRPFGADWLAS